MYRKTTLDNGVRIVTHVMPGMQSAALGILIKTGGRYEQEKDKGISHFTEHMLFKGSKNYSYRKIKESIEGVGGSLNAFTAEEITCYLAKLPSRHLSLALDILSDMVIHPLFIPGEIEKEKTVILEEIKMYKDLPQSYVHELLDELLWPDQPLGSSIIGTVETVSRMQKNDFQSYKKGYYTPANIIVSAAGLLKHESFVKDVAKIFAPLGEGSANEYTVAREINEQPRLTVLFKETEQTHMAMGFHSYPREHPLKYALALLNIILGANMSSRLFNEVREKRGLAYEIGTAVKRFHDTGAFIVHAGIDNRNVAQAIQLILKELTGISTRRVTLDEFRRAKDFYLGQIMLHLEDTLDHMLWIGEATAALDKTYTLKEIIRGVEKVTRQDIREAASTIFRRERIKLALIGPVQEEYRATISEHLNF